MTSRIKHVKATQVIVHAKGGYVDRAGFGPSIFDKGPKWIIEIQADDGSVGYGETPRNVGLGNIQYATKHILGKTLAQIPWAAPIPPNFSNHDMFGHKDPPVPHRLYERHFGTDRGALGVVIALQDLIAKSIDMRLCDLIGGPHREQIATDWWMGRTDAEHAAKQMQAGLESGYNSVKIKAAAEDDLVAIVSAIKKVAGEQTRVLIDPNLRFYRLSESIRIAHQIEDAGFTNVVFEDPFPFDLHEWGLFREKTSLPLACHTATSLHNALANRCCDYVNINFPGHKFLGDAHMVGEFGSLCWIGAGIDLGILDAYMLHYASAARVCVLPGDAVGHDIRVDDLIQEKLQAHNGTIDLPQGPGLGVTVDPDALERFAQQTWNATA